MFCHNCGTENEEVARFCCNCGTQLKAAFISKSTRKTVVLASCGANKLNVIKEIRILTGADLQEALKLAESVPVVLKTDVENTEVQRIKSAFESAGATIEIRE